MKKRILSALTAAVMTFTTLTAMIPAAAEEPAPTTNPPETALSVNGANTFGALAAELYETETLPNSGCFITDITMVGNMAAVRLSAANDCELVVAVYDESGTAMITSASAAVSAGDSTAALTLSGELPQYYLLRGYMIEPDTGRALCEEYESIEYTRAKQEFNALTTEDFPADRVHNFDEDITNNFAVFRDDVKVMPKNAGYNKVISADDENRVYVFGHPDDNFKSLKKGDMFTYSYAVIGLIIAEVSDVYYSSIDDTLTIRGAQIDLNDAFELVKINVSAGTEDLVFYEDGQRIKETLLDEDFAAQLETKPAALSEDGAAETRSITAPSAKAGADDSGYEVGWDNEHIITLNLSTKIEKGKGVSSEATATLFGYGDGEFEHEFGDNLSFKVDTSEGDVDKARKKLEELKEKIKNRTSLENPSAWSNSAELKLEAAAEFEIKINIPKIAFKIETSDAIGKSFAFDMDYIAEFTLAISAKFEADFIVAKLSIPPLLAVGIDVGVELHLIFNINAEIAQTQRAAGHISLHVNDKVDSQYKKNYNLSSDYPEFSSEIAGKGSASLTLQLKPLINVLGGLAETSLEGNVGVEFQINADKTDDMITEGDAHKHAMCIGTSITIFAQGAFNLSALFGLASLELKTDKLSYSTFGHFYTEEPSGEWHHAQGVCRYLSDYEAHIIKPTRMNEVGDVLGDPVSGMKVYIYAGSDNADSLANVDRSVLVEEASSNQNFIQLVNVLSYNSESFHWLPDKYGYIPYKFSGKPDSGGEVYRISFDKSRFNEKHPSDGYNRERNPLNFYVDCLLEPLEFAFYEENDTYLNYIRNVRDGKLTIIGEVDSKGSVIDDRCAAEYTIPAMGDPKVALELIPGASYLIRVEAFGYEPINEMIVTLPTRGEVDYNSPYGRYTQRIYLTKHNSVAAHFVDDMGEELSFDGYKGTIHFTSDPALTNVDSIYENDKDIEISNPTEYFKLPFGTYRVSISIPGFEEYSSGEEKITISADTGTLEFVMVPIRSTALITLTCEDGNTADGAEIYCDGRLLGTVALDASGGYSLSAELTLGQHLFTVVRAGCEDYSVTKTFEENKTIDILIGDSSAANSEGDFEYSKNNDSITITKYKGTRTEVVIPDTIEGCPVVEIGGFGGTDITSVVIPDSVKTIAIAAFEGCASLSDVTLPEGLETINGGAFKNCSSLKSISIPSTVTSVSKGSGTVTTRNGAFYNSGLETAILADGIQEIGYALFSDCMSLKTVSIPVSVKNIAESAFSNCKALESIDIPDSVETIGASAFYHCDSLESIELPAGLAEVSVKTFELCGGLKKVVLSNSIASINEGAFLTCRSLESIHIPSSVKRIEKNAFSECAGLKTVTFEDGLEYLGDGAFAKTGLTGRIYLPTTTLDVFNTAFNGCENITAVYINNLSTGWGGNSLFGGVPFSRLTNLKALIFSYDDISGTGNKGIVDMELSSSSLELIYIDPNRTDINENLLTNCPNAKIYGAAGSYAETYANEKSITFVPVSSEAELNGYIDGLIGTQTMSLTADAYGAAAASVASFTDLRPNEIYTFYSVKDKSAGDLFSEDNLLYIRNAETDGNGALTINYVPAASSGTSEEFVVRMLRDSIENASVSIENIIYDGMAHRVIPDVTLNGKALVYDIDFFVLGDWEEREIGTYTVDIYGIGDYSGVISASYDITRAEVSSISVKSLPDRTEYYAGEKPELSGCTLTVTYTDGSTEDIPVYENMTSGFDSAVIGEQIVTVTYGGKTAGFKVKVLSNASEPEQPTEPENPSEPSKPSTPSRPSTGGSSGGSRHTHSYGEWVITSNANCLKDGERTRTCKTCGHTDTEKIPQTDHEYAVIGTHEADEKTVGYTDYICIYCAQTKREYDVLLGDVDRNGAVNSIDAALILVSIVNDKKLDKTIADYNQDGAVNAIDAAAILKWTVGLKT